MSKPQPESIEPEDVVSSTADTDSTMSEDSSNARNPSAEAWSALQAELAQLREEMRKTSSAKNEAVAEALRHQAELENFRRRMRREMDDSLRYATIPLLKDLLPTIDNLERAVQAAEKTGQSSSLLDGVRMVLAQFASSLEKNGCLRMRPEGTPFDPHWHEAIGQQPHPEIAAQHVAAVVQAGYQFEDRVVRPALVMVSTGPAS